MFLCWKRCIVQAFLGVKMGFRTAVILAVV